MNFLSNWRLNLYSQTAVYKIDCGSSEKTVRWLSRLLVDFRSQLRFEWQAGHTVDYKRWLITFCIRVMQTDNLAHTIHTVWWKCKVLQRKKYWDKHGNDWEKTVITNKLISTEPINHKFEWTKMKVFDLNQSNIAVSWYLQRNGRLYKTELDRYQSFKTCLIRMGKTDPNELLMKRL